MASLWRTLILVKCLMTVADLLAASRAAHLQKKHAAGRVDRVGTVIAAPDYPKAEQHAEDALNLRLQAHELDPEMADPAWAQDEALNGCSTAMVESFLRRYPTIP